MVRIAIREKFGVSKPRNSGLDRGGSNLRSVNLRDRRPENRNLPGYWYFSLDCDDEGRVGYPGSSSPLSRVKRGGSAWMSSAAGFSEGSGLELSSLVRICSMLRAWGGKSRTIQRLSLIHIYIIAASCTLFAAQHGFGLSPYIAFRPSPYIHCITISFLSGCQGWIPRTFRGHSFAWILGRWPWNPIRGKDEAPQSAWWVCGNVNSVLEAQSIAIFSRWRTGAYCTI